MIPKKHHLDKHCKTEKHEESVRANDNVTDVRPIDSDIKVSRPFRDRKILEIKMAAFIAEHCSIRTVDLLGELISSIIPAGAQEIRLRRTKCSRLILSVIAPSLRQELVQDIKGSYFSLLIHESTDVGTLKMLCIVVRYYSFQKRKMITTLYRLVCLDACDAASISEVILDCLQNDGLEIDRMLGIGTDNAAVMVGVHNSVYTKLREIQPHLVLVRCVCHSLALAASKAAATLPTKLDFLIEQTYAWFARCNKRQSQFKEIYGVINGGKKPLKILRYVETRWLSRYECVKRIMDQFDELKLYFQQAAQDERSYAAVQLSQIYCEKDCYPYLVFLESVWKLITDKNKLFQSENANP